MVPLLVSVVIVPPLDNPDPAPERVPLLSSRSIDAPLVLDTALKMLDVIRPLLLSVPTAPLL
jgi:hypothetical protein